MWGTLLGALGGMFSGGAGSESTTDQKYNSDTKGSSKIDRSEFSSSIIKSLEGLFGGNKLGKAQDASNAALTGQLENVQKDAAHPFDVKGFVQGIMKGARNTANNDLATGINAAEQATGGTGVNNSMSALLTNKLQTNTASQLAGIKAQATGQGEQIAQQGMESSTNQVTGLTGALNKGLTDFLTLLRGAQTTQTQSTTEHTEGTGTSTQSTPFNPLGALGGFFGSFKPPAA